MSLRTQLPSQALHGSAIRGLGSCDLIVANTKLLGLSLLLLRRCGSS